MSVPGFNRPGDGAGIKKSIKSIQRIAVTISSTTQTVTIAPVNPANTLVMMDLTGPVSNIAINPNIELTNATTLTISVNQYPSPSYTVYVTVIEFMNVKSKQTGSATAISGNIPNPYNVTISAVNPSKCLAFASMTCSSGATGPDVASATVTNNKTLTIYSGYGPGLSGTVKWQVIEFL
jgi:hypothetical protein